MSYILIIAFCFVTPTGEKLCDSSEAPIRAGLTCEELVPSVMLQNTAYAITNKLGVVQYSVTCEEVGAE